MNPADFEFENPNDNRFFEFENDFDPNDLLANPEYDFKYDNEKEEDSKEDELKDYKNWFQSIIVDYRLDEIPYGDFERKTRIGRGGFGTVYKTESKSLGYVAIKEVESETDEKVKKLFINELKQLNRSTYHRIIKFYGISLNEKEKKCYLVMEYANNGTLREHLQEKELEWPEKIRLAIQIADGVSYLHGINITHRDLHTLNILIHDGNVKISDFGLSKNLNSALSTGSKKIFGVIPFIDPQKLYCIEYPCDEKSDVYSFGVLMWEISSNGRPPFDQTDHTSTFALAFSIIRGLREEPITGTPIHYIDLYSKCWDSEPNERPSMTQIFQRLKSLKLDPKYDDNNQNRSLNGVNANFENVDMPSKQISLNIPLQIYNLNHA